MSIEIRSVYDPINGEPMPNVKQLRLGKQYMQINTSWAAEIERLQRRSDALDGHGWIPNLLIDHDAPICEVCEGLMDAHDGEALITQEFFRLKDALEIAEKALQKHLDQPEGPSMDIVREALTAIAATTAQAGEEK
jgi:hypothetical protein